MSERMEGDGRDTELAAVEWVVRHDAGLSPAEQAEFAQWRAASPGHDGAFALARQAWGAFDALRSPAKAGGHTWRRRRSFRLAVLAGVAASLTLSLWTAQKWTDARLTHAPQVAAVPSVTERKLGDGSIAQLNRGAALEIEFTGGQRLVRLVRGEAHFTVAKDASRPFVVRAAGIDLRAVGTAFNVRLGSAAIDVIVTEGRVRVLARDGWADGGEDTVLNVGERAVLAVNDAGASVRIEPVSPEAIAEMRRWRPELLEFTSTPLGEVVAEFNRANAVQLVVADPELSRMPIVASIRSDNPEGFVRLLETSAGVKAQREGQTLILRKAR